MLDIPCDYNFRHGHCVCRKEYGNGPCSCNSALENGIAVVHGNIFGFDNYPLKIIYENMRNVRENMKVELCQVSFIFIT